MSFEEQRLEDLCELVIDCPHSTPKWTDKGFIVLRNQNIRNGVLDLSAPSFTDEDGYKRRIKRAKPRVNDIVFTREAPMGEVCLIPEGIDCCLGQRQVLLRANNEIDPYYLFWALQSPYVQHQISWNEGTGTTVSNVRIPVLKDLKIPRLEGHESWIAKTMTSLALKSQINEKINHTLEQMAQALFKSWFVDFEPVKAKIAVLEAGGSQEDATLAAMTAISGKDADALMVFEREHPEHYAELKSTAELFPSAMHESELGEIPKGWRSGSITNVTDKVFSGGTPTTTKSEYWNGEFHWFSSGETRNSVITNTEKTITKLGVEQSSTKESVLGDVLIASAGQGHTRGQTSLNMINTYINQSVVAVRPKNTVFTCWLYMNLRSRYEEMRAISDSHSSRGSLTTKLVSGMPVVIPDENILQKFEKSIFPLFDSVKLSQREIDSLAQLRDTLLPKLLSGEITLPEAEQAVSEAENV